MDDRVKWAGWAPMWAVMSAAALMISGALGVPLGVATAAQASPVPVPVVFDEPDMPDCDLDPADPACAPALPVDCVADPLHPDCVAPEDALPPEPEPEAAPPHHPKLPTKYPKVPSLPHVPHVPHVPKLPKHSAPDAPE